MTEGLTESAQPALAMPVENSGVMSAQQPSSQGFNQEKIDGLFNAGYGKGHAKGVQEGYEKAAREWQQNQGNYSPVQPQQPQIPQGHAPQMQAQAQSALTIDDFRRIAREENQQVRQEAQLAQFYQDFSGKIVAGAGSKPDYDSKVSSLVYNLKESNPNDFMRLAQIVNAADNAADVMYDLANNPHKVNRLLSAANPYLAHAELQNLSNSIKQNQVPQTPKVNPPLSQLQPSHIGTGNDSLTVDDYAQRDWARF